MKKSLAFALTLVMVFTAVSAAFAYSWFDNTYPLYKVESDEGQCPLYDRPSSDGHDLGPCKNGDQVRVIWDNGNGWLYVVCTNGREGYIPSSVLKPVRSRSSRPTCVVCSADLRGSCAMLDQPSESGFELCRLNDGESVEIVDWDVSEAFAQILYPRTGECGYLRKADLQPCN